MLLAWAVATPLILLGSRIAVRVANRPGKSREVRSVVVVGVNDVGLEFAAICDRHPNLFMQVRGFFDDRDGDRRPAELPHPDARQDGRARAVRAQQRHQDDLSSASRSRRSRASASSSKSCRIRRPPCISCPTSTSSTSMQARFDNVGGMPVIAICETPFMGLNSTIKRGSDIVLS
ncbi:hypothetical protein [Massilia phosphatilytica]